MWIPGADAQTVCNLLVICKTNTLLSMQNYLTCEKGDVAFLWQCMGYGPSCKGHSIVVYYWCTVVYWCTVLLYCTCGWWMVYSTAVMMCCTALVHSTHSRLCLVLCVFVQALHMLTSSLAGSTPGHVLHRCSLWRWSKNHRLCHNNLAPHSSLHWVVHLWESGCTDVLATYNRTISVSENKAEH